MFIELLQNNAEKWNEWRNNNPAQTPSLRQVDFVSELMKDKDDYYDLPEFYDIDFSDADLHMASLRNCMFINCVYV